MFFASYDRSFEPNYFQMFSISLTSAAVATTVSHPFDFLKTKIQLYNEGIGIRGRGIDMGYNMYKVFTNFTERGYGT